MYDIIIIGAGVTGCAIARELSRYEARICVVERCSDVCEGTSKANSAIVHAGYDAPAGSVKARMNVAGNERMEALCRELDVPFRRIGSLVICMEEERLPELQALYDRGMANGVQGLQILDRVQTLELEPGLSDEVRGALFAPSAGIVCPFELTIALAENAAENGVEFRLNTEVTGIVREENGYRIRTEKGDMNARMVVNAAGVYADAFHNMVSRQKIHITPRRFDSGRAGETHDIPAAGKVGKRNSGYTYGSWKYPAGAYSGGYRRERRHKHDAGGTGNCPE